MTRPKIKCCVDIPDLEQADAPVTELISGKHKVLVVEAAGCAVVRRRVVVEENFVMLLGKTPTCLDVIERDKW